MLSRLTLAILCLAIPSCLFANNPDRDKLPYKIEFQLSADQFPKNIEFRVELRAIVCIRDQRIIQVAERPVFGFRRRQTDPNAGPIVFDRHTLATRSTEPLVWNVTFDDDGNPKFDESDEWGEFILPFDRAIEKMGSDTAVVFTGHATMLIDGVGMHTMNLRSPMMPWHPARSGGWGLKVENMGTVSVMDAKGNVLDSNTTMQTKFFSPPNYDFEIIVLPKWATDPRNQDQDGQ
ncbi:MAG: hypothetical protein LBC63_03935 [Holophagales bacterium]|jgi:hypothetical protein|nr:hypothetical protein [Holophagales bacterium]